MQSAFSFYCLEGIKFLVRTNPPARSDQGANTLFFVFSNYCEIYIEKRADNPYDSKK